MQVNLANPHLTYTMSDDELQLSHLLNDLQTANIKNLIVDTVNLKLALKPDVTNPNQYWQEESYLRGQLDILTHLLTLSDAARSEVQIQSE